MFQISCHRFQIFTLHVLSAQLFFPVQVLIVQSLSPICFLFVFHTAINKGSLSVKVRSLASAFGSTLSPLHTVRQRSTANICIIIQLITNPMKYSVPVILKLLFTEMRQGVILAVKKLQLSMRDGLLFLHNKSNMMTGFM